jgi:hypothetical protein
MARTAGSDLAAFLRDRCSYIDLFILVAMRKRFRGKYLKLFWRKIRLEHFQKRRYKESMNPLVPRFGSHAHWTRWEESIVEKQLEQCTLDSFNYPDMICEETKILARAHWQPYEKLQDVVRSHKPVNSRSGQRSRFGDRLLAVLNLKRQS